MKKNYEVSEMIETVFNTETFKQQTEEDIIKYENLYKTKVLEELADFIEENYELEDIDEVEDSMLAQYNEDNLVYFFKSML